jgi:hypothetical protein
MEKGILQGNSARVCLKGVMEHKSRIGDAILASVCLGV